jgi:protein phosphatase
MTEYFESAEASDVGRKRKNNEDACLRLSEHGVFCVADGMGGQAGGDLASEAITTTLQQVFTKSAPEAPATFGRQIELFRQATNQASKWIKNFADEKVIGQMGSTIVALVIDPRNPARAVGLHAGDSRLYRFRNDELKQITADHSAVAALAAKLGCAPESIPAKYQNELLRAVGLTEAVELEKTPVDVATGDLYLICSDGLTKMQTDEQIEKILKASAKDPLATVAQKLINAANDAGGKDNVTVVLVKAGDLSGAPKVIDPNEDEDKTMAAPVTLLPVEMSPRLNQLAQVPAMPDTADIHGDTPPTPHTEDTTPEKAATANPPTPSPSSKSEATPTPDPTPASFSAPTSITKTLTAVSAPKTPTKLLNQTSPKPETKRVFRLRIVIVTVLILAAGVSIWFSCGSKSKTSKSAAAPPIQADPAELPSRRQQSTVTFEKMLVWFGVKQPTDAGIQTAEARSQQPLRGTLSEQQRQQYLDTVAMLESEFSKAGTLSQNDRAKYLKEMKDAISFHE